METKEPCPFSVFEVEDQIRAVYGPLNNYMSFLASDGGTFAAITESGNDLRREALPWVKGYLLGRTDLDQGQVPTEVLHWLDRYRKKNQKLINFLKE